MNFYLAPAAFGSNFSFIFLRIWEPEMLNTKNKKNKAPFGSEPRWQPFGALLFFCTPLLGDPKSVRNFGGGRLYHTRAVHAMEWGRTLSCLHNTWGAKPWKSSSLKKNKAGGDQLRAPAGCAACRGPPHSGGGGAEGTPTGA